MSTQRARSFIKWCPIRQFDNRNRVLTGGIPAFDSTCFWVKVESPIPFVVVLDFRINLFLVFIWGRVGASVFLAASLNHVCQLLIGRVFGSLGVRERARGRIPYLF